jgi:hypothetical protein
MNYDDDNLTLTLLPDSMNSHTITSASLVYLIALSVYPQHLTQKEAVN